MCEAVFSGRDERRDLCPQLELEGTALGQGKYTQYNFVQSVQKLPTALSWVSSVSGA
jgi:hypothetical protein